MPERIQLSRAKGWRKPENTVVVSRPGKFGNPISMLDVGGDRGPVTWTYPSVDEIRTELAGKNLACWCDLDMPCHADVLLTIANGAAA